jgi:type I restriction enzyme M protein
MAKRDYYEILGVGKSATLDEIKKANYSLAPSKYVEFIDHDLEIDYGAEMTRIQAEMREVLNAEKESQAMLEEAFRGIGYGID